MREIIINVCCTYDIVCSMIMSTLPKTFFGTSAALLHLINKYALISRSSSSSYNWNRHTCYNEKGLKKMAMWSGHWCYHKSNKNRLLKKGSFNHSAQPEWPGLLSSKLEGSSSNPHKSIVGVFPSFIKN